MNIFTEEKEQEFLSTILPEVENRYQDLSERRTKLSKYRRQRINEPRQKVKNFPFPNASNVTPPLTSSILQTIYGNTKNTFQSLRDLWNIKPLRLNDKELAKQTKALNKYFNILSESPQDLNLRAKNKVIFYEANSLGTSFVKIVWTKDEWKFNRMGADGNTEEIIATSHNGPEVIPVQEEDVVYPSGSDDIQRLPWFATISHLFLHEIEHKEDIGIYEEGVSEALRGFEQSGDHKRDNYLLEENRQNRPGDLPKTLDVYEIFCFFDPDDSGVNKDIIVKVHLPSQTILSAEYNEMGLRPFENFQYMHIPYSLTGRGVCQMCEGMQDTVEAYYNMRVDNDKFAINQVLVYKKDRGIQPNMTVYPGKMIGVEESDDIVPMKFGQVQNATIPAEQQAFQLAGRNAGASDTMAGFADQTLKSRDTLGGQNLRLQQGNGMFNAVIEGMKDSFSRVGRVILYYLINNRNTIIDKESKIGRMSEEELLDLEKILNIPLEEVPLKFSFSIKTRDIEETKDIKRNNLMMLFGLQNQYFQANAPIVMQLSNPQQPMPPEAHEFFSKQFEGQTRILNSMLELLNFDVPDDYIVDIDQYVEQQQQKKMQMVLQEMMGQVKGGMPGLPVGPQQSGQGGPSAGPAGPSGQSGQPAGQAPQGDVNDFRR